MRPEIRPAIFIPLQNGLAALLFAVLLGAEMVRRLLDVFPQSELLWRLSVLANRSVMPVLHYVEGYLPTPDKLALGLAAGVAIPLLAWWTRYWFATALAGHLTLLALVLMAYQAFTRGNLQVASLGLPDQVDEIGFSLAFYGLVALSLFVLVMCIADHVAFMRHIVWLWRKISKRRQPSAS